MVSVFVVFFSSIDVPFHYFYLENCSPAVYLAKPLKKLEGIVLAPVSARVWR